MISGTKRVRRRATGAQRTGHFFLPESTRDNCRQDYEESWVLKNEEDFVRRNGGEYILGKVCILKGQGEWRKRRETKFMVCSRNLAYYLIYIHFM